MTIIDSMMANPVLIHHEPPFLEFHGSRDLKTESPFSLSGSKGCRPILSNFGRATQHCKPTGSSPRLACLVVCDFDPVGKQEVPFRGQCGEHSHLGLGFPGLEAGEKNES